MKRMFWLIAIFLFSGVCAAGAWLAFHPPVDAFLGPGATEIVVTDVGFGEQHIRYRSPGSPYAWYWATVHTIEAQGWVRHLPLRPDFAGPSYNGVLPLQFERISFGFLIEEVMLSPNQSEPSQAHIDIYRRISIPWPYFSWRLWLA